MWQHIVRNQKEWQELRIQDDIKTRQRKTRIMLCWLCIKNSLTSYLSRLFPIPVSEATGLFALIKTFRREAKTYHLDVYV